MIVEHVRPMGGAAVDVHIAKGRITAEGTTEALLEMSGKTNLEDAFVKLAGIDDEQHQMKAA